MEVEKANFIAVNSKDTGSAGRASLLIMLHLNVLESKQQYIKLEKNGNGNPLT